MKVLLTKNSFLSLEGLQKMSVKDKSIELNFEANRLERIEFPAPEVASESFHIIAGSISSATEDTIDLHHIETIIK